MTGLPIPLEVQIKMTEQRIDTALAMAYHAYLDRVSLDVQDANGLWQKWEKWRAMRKAENTERNARAVAWALSGVLAKLGEENASAHK